MSLSVPEPVELIELIELVVLAVLAVLLAVLAALASPTLSGVTLGGLGPVEVQSPPEHTHGAACSYGWSSVHSLAPDLVHDVPPSNVHRFSPLTDGGSAVPVPLMITLAHDKYTAPHEATESPFAG